MSTHAIQFSEINATSDTQSCNGGMEISRRINLKNLILKINIAIVRLVNEVIKML